MSEKRLSGGDAEKGVSEMMWGDHWMFGGYMWLFWILVLGGLIFLIWWIIKQSQSRPSGSEDDALEILKKKYAKGEIDKEEFEQKKKDILQRS